MNRDLTETQNDSITIMLWTPMSQKKLLRSQIVPSIQSSVWRRILQFERKWRLQSLCDKITHVWQLNPMQMYLSLLLFIACYWVLIEVRHSENFLFKHPLLIMMRWETFCTMNVTSLLVFQRSLGYCKSLIYPEKRWASAQSLFLDLVDYSFKDMLYNRMNNSEENEYNVWQSEDSINSYFLMSQPQMSVQWIENMIDLQLMQKQRLKSF